MGFLTGRNVIWLVRNPIFAFNSYSGGGWRSEGGKRRIEYVGAKDQNDVKWIDAFLGSFSHWVSTTQNAIQSVKDGNGHIVRYDSLKEDWKKIPAVPSICKGFSCKDSLDKVTDYLSTDTIDYITLRTGGLWQEVQDVCNG